MNKWKIKHIDNDTVLHFILKRCIMDGRSDYSLFPLSTDLISSEKANVYIVNEALLSDEELNKLQENNLIEVILLKQSSKTILKNLNEKSLIITKGKDSVLKIEEVVLEAIYRLSKRLNLNNQAS